MPIVVKSGINPGIGAIARFAAGKDKRAQQDAPIAARGIAQAKARRAAASRLSAQIASREREGARARSFSARQSELSRAFQAQDFAQRRKFDLADTESRREYERQKAVSGRALGLEDTESLREYERQTAESERKYKEYDREEKARLRLEEPSILADRERRRIRKALTNARISGDYTEDQLAVMEDQIIRMDMDLPAEAPEELGPFPDGENIGDIYTHPDFPGRQVTKNHHGVPELIGDSTVPTREDDREDFELGWNLTAPGPGEDKNPADHLERTRAMVKYIRAMRNPTPEPQKPPPPDPGGPVDPADPEQIEFLEGLFKESLERYEAGGGWPASAAKEMETARGLRKKINDLKGVSGAPGSEVRDDSAAAEPAAADLERLSNEWDEAVERYGVSRDPYDMETAKEIRRTINELPDGEVEIPPGVALGVEEMKELLGGEEGAEDQEPAPGQWVTRGGETRELPLPDPVVDTPVPDEAAPDEQSSMVEPVKTYDTLAAFEAAWMRKYTFGGKPSQAVIDVARARGILRDR